MQLQFDSIAELGEPGAVFKARFDTSWPEYLAWLEANATGNRPNLATSVAALEQYMPEMVPLYHKLCHLVSADSTAARFLTGFQPPAYRAACAQAVLAKEEVQLIRNYDYHPNLIEGTLLLSSWNGKKVIASSDCLIGALDGMNEDGLAVSLTFGGRQAVGEGFGIPFILRYVLEFCSTVDQAVSALTRIPSHMPYNVTVVDSTGMFKTVLLAPDRAPIVTDNAFTTNHQVKVDWFENAAFNKTVERSNFLKDLFDRDGLDAATVSDAFLKKPLYNTLFRYGFGTLYTAVYSPGKGCMQLRWLGKSIMQSFDAFVVDSHLIAYEDASPDEAETADDRARKRSKLMRSAKDGISVK